MTSLGGSHPKGTFTQYETGALFEDSGLQTSNEV